MYFLSDEDNLILGCLHVQSPRSLTPDKIKAVLGDDHTECNEETYDIYLLPPGEDPESCQSYLRMRNREGKYNLMFEVFQFHIQ
jgi:uridine kinase